MAVYTDNFNRADASPIDGNWTSINNGGSWVEITSNQVNNNNGTWGGYAISNQTYSDSHYSGIIYTGSSIDDDGGPSVRGRLSAGSMFNGYAATLYTPTVARIYVFTGVDGDGAQVGSDISGSFANGDLIELYAVGNKLTLWQNRIPIGSVTDSTYTTGGAPGITIYGSTATFDNWGGGDVTQDHFLRFIFELNS